MLESIFTTPIQPAGRASEDSYLEQPGAISTTAAISSIITADYDHTELLWPLTNALQMQRRQAAVKESEV